MTSSLILKQLDYSLLISKTIVDSGCTLKNVRKINLAHNVNG